MNTAAEQLPPPPSLFLVVSYQEPDLIFINDNKLIFVTL